MHYTCTISVGISLKTCLCSMHAINKILHDEIYKFYYLFEVKTVGSDDAILIKIRTIYVTRQGLAFLNIL